ncbi:MAG TPA: hypothetical protein PK781_03275 [Terrimesophilobacter sp.]|nr:hypothetical protein [Terrimesophilobacter sp.]
MTTKTALSRTATRYLQDLKRGLLAQEVDQATDALLTDVREALLDLSDAEAEEQITELGPAADIAQRRGSPPPRLS